MMNECELDRAIDAAAGAMMTREPSRSLGRTVMARVREAHAPAPRRAIHIVRSARSVATYAPLPLSDVSPIEPIQTEPIVLSSIEVPQLERETTAIDTLSIEPLTIEPLAASND